MNGNFVDLETINEDYLHVKNKQSNHSHLQNINNHHQHRATPVLTSTNNLITNGNNGSNKQLASFDLQQQQSGLKKCTQRKNTSDSNVKLLADHNFYHVTHRRGENGHRRINNSGSNNCVLDFNSGIPEMSPNSNARHQHQHSIFLLNSSGKVNVKPYELTDYFKYNSKYKRAGGGGLNSSSNSLISLNSSSAGTNEDSNANGNHSDLIRSNPDLKNTPIHSPTPSSLIGQQHQLQQQQQQNADGVKVENNSAKYDFYPNSFKAAADMTNLSHNLSLNLSIHTAEEFGIEMLEWLNNESNAAVAMASSSNFSNGDVKLANNATLV